MRIARLRELLHISLLENLPVTISVEMRIARLRELPHPIKLKPAHIVFMGRNEASPIEGIATLNHLFEKQRF